MNSEVYNQNQEGPDMSLGRETNYLIYQGVGQKGDPRRSHVMATSVNSHSEVTNKVYYTSKDFSNGNSNNMMEVV